MIDFLSICSNCPKHACLKKNIRKTQFEAGGLENEIRFCYIFAALDKSILTSIKNRFSIILGHINASVVHEKQKWDKNQGYGKRGRSVKRINKGNNMHMKHDVMMHGKVAHERKHIANVRTVSNTARKLPNKCAIVKNNNYILSLVTVMFGKCAWKLVVKISYSQHFWICVQLFSWFVKQFKSWSWYLCTGFPKISIFRNMFCIEIANEHPNSLAEHFPNSERTQTPKIMSVCSYHAGCRQIEHMCQPLECWKIMNKGTH